MKIKKKPAAEAEKPKRIPGEYLDDEELKEVGLEKRFVDPTAYEMLEKYCILQKLRRGEAIQSVEATAAKVAERNK